jgi:hypothetical protein
VHREREREGSRAGHWRERGEATEPWRDELWRTSGGELERSSAGGDLIEEFLSHAMRGRRTWAAWWARPVHFLLLLSFSFFLHQLLL